MDQTSMDFLPCVHQQDRLVRCWKWEWKARYSAVRTGSTWPFWIWMRGKYFLILGYVPLFSECCRRWDGYLEAGTWGCRNSSFFFVFLLYFLALNLRWLRSHEESMGLIRRSYPYNCSYWLGWNLCFTSWLWILGDWEATKNLWVWLGEVILTTVAIDWVGTYA